MLIFDASECIPIYIANQNPYARLCAEDLAKDLARVNRAGLRPRFLDKEEKSCIVIEENDPSIEDPITDESFRILIKDQKIRISAPTYFGTMWGIYTFSQEILGTDPCYLFHTLPSPSYERLEAADTQIYESGSDFGFRGAFINDEDLLTGWKDGGGKRFMDYPWYGTTVSPEIMDMVVETLLRLKINLVIPASFLDIDNPPEKHLADCVARRGIYISQHHIEPLGLSHFTFENYCKRFGKVGTYSYLSSAELLEEAWCYYVKKWSGYERVVWQLGLRGKADRPIWEEDTPTDKELCEYGKFISDAIERQRQIVLSQTNGRAKHFTSTLWMEGSTLMERGYLRVSPDVCLVFSDNGPNQMFGNEYLRVPRKADGRYGIYYHLQYFNIGPHLAPQTGIEKIRYNLKKAYENKDHAYCILNISNLREFTAELYAAAGMLWSIHSDENFLSDFCENAFAERASEAEALISRYFAISPTLPPEELSNVHAKYFNYDFEEKAEGIKNFVLKDGLILFCGMDLINAFFDPQKNDFHEKIYFRLKTAEPHYAKLCEDFDALISSLDAEHAKFTRATFWLYTKSLHSFYLWFISLFDAKTAYQSGNTEETETALKHACLSLEDYLNARTRSEYGSFKNWYRGENKMNVRERLLCTRKLLDKVIKAK
jgi:hypothetical protein